MMTLVEACEVNLRLLPFKGKSEEWRMWSGKFLSKARKKGYRDILLGRKMRLEDGSGSGSDGALTAEEIKKNEEIDKLNDDAYDDLIMSMEDKVAFAKVDNARSDSYPEGCCKTAWESLVGKYKPQTVQSRAELKLKFAQC